MTVASADETAGKAAEAGGNVIAEAFDVMDVGRMAVIADPTGAALCLWEPRQHIGATLVLPADPQGAVFAALTSGQYDD